MRELPQPFDPTRARKEVLTVSQLNQQAKRLLESCFPDIWVEGEVSNVAEPASGHCYFSLKDEHAQARCALFRGRRELLDYQPADGDHVVARARVTLYENRGDFQLVIQHIEEAGEGALRRAFEALKRKLHEQGLFDSARKRPIPPLPRRVGIITSPTGAAIRDIVSTFRRRFPAIPLLLYPTIVQGRAAAAEITQTIELAGQRNECDVLILARGGGSLEDLWPFNEEQVARAIFDCPIPIVCGVGHEIDVTISDLVADCRAATPTAAAELVSPDITEIEKTVLVLGQSVKQCAQRRLERLWQQTDWMAKRLRHPKDRLHQARARLTGLYNRLTAAGRSRLHTPYVELAGSSTRLLRSNPAAHLRVVAGETRSVAVRVLHAAHHRLERERHRLTTLAARMHNVSPLATLGRGYALVTDIKQTKLLTDAGQLKLKQRIMVRLARGRLTCTVDEVLED